MRKISFKRHVAPLLGLLAGIAPRAAMAAGGGGALPWDAPLSTIASDISGPTVAAVALIMIVLALAAYFHRGELGDWGNRIVLVCLTVGSAVGAAKILTMMGVAGAIL